MQIREKDRQTMLHLFGSITAPVQIWAYGSRVKGTAHEGSDLDLVLRTSDLKPLAWEEYTELIEKIKESNIPILVELRDWARLPHNFHKQITEQYEVFFSNIDQK